MLDELNSMTRLIISLGLVGLTNEDTVLNTQNVYFVHIGSDHIPPDTINNSGDKANTGTGIDSNMAVIPLRDLKFRKCQVYLYIYTSISILCLNSYIYICI